jgi:hypothetical protein
VFAGKVALAHASQVQILSTLFPALDSRTDAFACHVALSRVRSDCRSD